MNTRDLKTWIERLIKIHGLSQLTTVDKVWHNYCQNSGDDYINVCDAFAASGFDIT